MGDPHCSLQFGSARFEAVRILQLSSALNHVSPLQMSSSFNVSFGLRTEKIQPGCIIQKNGRPGLVQFLSETSGIIENCI